MQPGLQMDSLIARTLFKAIVVVDTATGEHHLVAPNRAKLPLPRYSTEVTDSHKLAEYFKPRGYALHVRSNIVNGVEQWTACFLRADGRAYVFSDGETMPMAICHAALSAARGTNVSR